MMPVGRFEQLFGLTLEHAFFAPRPCRALQFHPTVTTAAELAATGCLFRPIDTGFEICRDLAMTAALKQQLSQPWQLVFLGFSNDPQFANYTEGLGTRERPVCFAGQELCEIEPVMPQQVRTVPGVPQHRGPPCGRRREATPVCVITLQLARDALIRSPIQYLLRLAARATRWKYYFTGNWPSLPLRIIDAAGLLQFEPPRTERVPNGSDARVIVSASPIALQERPSQRLSLLARHATGDRTLIKRLPMASPAHLACQSLANTTAWMSEIYVAG
jgi:hypothetical protein